MRIDTTHKTRCCGCGACVAICPKACIRMQSDEEGFAYPVVDIGACVECGKCLQVCGMQNGPDLHDVQETYAAWHLDKQIRAKGTSGSVFMALAEAVIRSGGVVAGAVFADQCKAVKHVLAGSLAEADAFHGSKYVQSDTLASFQTILSRIKAGDKILFSGTPCQVGSLRRLVGDAQNLITCDIVCHGVPSPEVFRRYLTELEIREGAAVVGYSFRDKRKGWNFPRVRISLADGRTITRSPWADPFFNGFSRNVFLRPCCHHCPYATDHRVGDITLADCWRVAASHPAYDDNQGTSLVLVNTRKGRDVLEAVSGCQRVFLGPYDLQLACTRNAPLRKPSARAGCRDVFFARFRETGSFTRAAEAYIRKGDVVRMHMKQVVKKWFWPLLRRFQ